MGIVAALTELASGIASVFVSVLTALSEVFITSVEGTGGAVALALTPIGYVALIGLVITIIYFLFNWLTRLFKQRAR